jgi:hypothetical protein
MSRLNLNVFLTSLFFVFISASIPVSADSGVSAATSIARAALPKGSTKDFGPAPEVTNAPLSTEVTQALDYIFGGLEDTGWGEKQKAGLETIAESGDVRIAWLLADLIRFLAGGGISDDLTVTADKLLGTNFSAGFRRWNQLSNHLIAWDIPAPPDYLKYKRQLFSAVLPEWEALFTEGDIDWRHVSWGGVNIDNREFDKTDERCNCIPAADNPKVTNAKEATWLSDDDVVFGVGINGEYRAYPRQIMEVREMVNDTLGGRDLGIPYCTLCGSAQAWFTDDLPEGIERPVLRTSGLLIRSNKVMFDLNTMSVFDTFRGNAVNGPLAKRGLQLKQAAVVTTTWGEWKEAHPETTVLIEALALGQNHDFRNNRDAKGPIFPIGNADPRLAVHEDILGVITESGTPWAFHVPSLIKALNAGEDVMVENVKILHDAGGVRAVTTKGESLGTHQAFWFAWSQFYPDTQLWPE